MPRLQGINHLSLAADGLDRARELDTRILGLTFYGRLAGHIAEATGERTPQRDTLHCPNGDELVRFEYPRAHVCERLMGHAMRAADPYVRGRAPDTAASSSLAIRGRRARSKPGTRQAIRLRHLPCPAPSTAHPHRPAPQRHGPRGHRRRARDRRRCLPRARRRPILLTWVPRNLLAGLRDTGAQVGGPPPFDLQARQRFTSTLDRELTRAARFAGGP